jgi:hypothetical protein
LEPANPIGFVGDRGLQLSLIVGHPWMVDGRAYLKIIQKLFFQFFFKIEKKETLGVIGLIEYKT